MKKEELVTLLRLLMIAGAFSTGLIGFNASAMVLPLEGTAGSGLDAPQAAPSLDGLSNGFLISLSLGGITWTIDHEDETPGRGNAPPPGRFRIQLDKADDDPTTGLNLLGIRQEDLTSPLHPLFDQGFSTP